MEEAISVLEAAFSKYAGHASNNGKMSVMYCLFSSVCASSQQNLQVIFLRFYTLVSTNAFDNSYVAKVVPRVILQKKVGHPMKFTQSMK